MAMMSEDPSPQSRGSQCCMRALLVACKAANNYEMAPEPFPAALGILSQVRFTVGTDQTGQDEFNTLDHIVRLVVAEEDGRWM